MHPAAEALIIELEAEAPAARRVLDLPVPAVYGKGADENPLAAAAASR